MSAPNAIYFQTLVSEPGTRLGALYVLTHPLFDDIPVWIESSVDESPEDLARNEGFEPEHISYVRVHVSKSEFRALRAELPVWGEERQA